VGVAVAAPAVVVAATVVVVAAVAAAATESTNPDRLARLTSSGGAKAHRFLFAAQLFRLGLRPRPLTSRSNTALGSNRISLATTPICHGITR
jgi:predicted alpha/beta-hydrolase family hydrolase